MGFWGFFCCVFLLNLSLPNRRDWYQLSKKFWDPHSNILSTSPGFTPLLNHAPCLYTLQLLKQSKAQAGQQIHQGRLLIHFLAVPKPEPNAHNSSLQLLARTLLPLPCGPMTSTRSPIYLDALEVDCRFFGLGWCRCWCWSRRWCCSCCWFLYVLLWCHFVLLKLESKSVLKKKRFKKIAKQKSLNKWFLGEEQWSEWATACTLEVDPMC